MNDYGDSVWYQIFNLIYFIENLLTVARRKWQFHVFVRAKLLAIVAMTNVAIYYSNSARNTATASTISHVTPIAIDEGASLLIGQGNLAVDDCIVGSYSSVGAARTPNEAVICAFLMPVPVGLAV